MSCIHCNTYEYFDSTFCERKGTSICVCKITEEECINFIEKFINMLGVHLKFSREFPLCDYAEIVKEITSYIPTDTKNKYILEQHESSKILHLAEKYKRIFISKYLDVGCGRGYRLNLVKKNYDCNINGCDVYSTTESCAQLTNLKPVHGNHKNVDNTIISYGKLQYSDNSFHLISCINFLQFIPTDKQLRKLISEIYRVTHPTGIVILKCFNCCNYKTYYQLMLLHEFLIRANLIDKSPYQFHSVNYVRKLVVAAGFKIIHILSDRLECTLVLKKTCGKF